MISATGDRMLKISVKGSQDGSWGLTMSFKAGRDYNAAADEWLKKHSKKTIFCLVQFKGVVIDALPRVYLATPSEIASWLKSAAAGRGDTVLYEEHIWANRAQAAGTVDRIPNAWKFSEERLNELAKAA